MIRAKVPEFLWAKAVGCSVYIHNILLNSQTRSGVTAYEALIGNIPTLEHIRIFGCKAYSQIPRQQRSTWDPKAKMCILVGYQALKSKYRLYDPAGHTVIIAHNVSFDEN